MNASTSKDRNKRNNTRIRNLVTSDQTPIKVIREPQADGILICAVDITRSRKILRKALQQINKTYRIPLKDIDPKVIQAIQFIRSGQADSISEASHLAGVPDYKVRYAIRGMVGNEVSNG